uniref:Uncharacterized protein n=1 Tax=Oryza rufipogon TaxID=4529 RepID=A0A0E0NR92_ORYRU
MKSIWEKNYNAVPAFFLYPCNTRSSERRKVQKHLKLRCCRGDEDEASSSVGFATLCISWRRKHVARDRFGCKKKHYDILRKEDFLLLTERQGPWKMSGSMTTDLLIQVQAPRRLSGQVQLSMALLSFLTCRDRSRLLIILPNLLPPR